MADVRCPKCGGRTVILTDKKDDRRYYVCVNRPACKGRIAVDDVGYDDGVRRKTAPKKATNKPRQPRSLEAPPARKKVAKPVTTRRKEEKNRPGSGFKRSIEEAEVPDEVSWGDDWSEGQRGDWGDDWGGGSPAPKRVVAKPRPQREPKAAHDVSRRRKEPVAAPEIRKRPTALKKNPAPAKKKPLKPEHKQAVGSRASAREKELIGTQPLTEGEEELLKKKRRNLIVMIIALVVAFLAIDGMIYAAVLLR